jgi:copper(I)-binding protein
MPNTLPMAAYFTVSNSSATPIDLVNIDTAAFAHSMLHRTERKGGMADMTMVERWPIPAKGSVQAAPGGYHAMLEKPVKPLVIGSEIPLTFTFSGNRTVSVPCRINPASALGY